MTYVIKRKLYFVDPLHFTSAQCSVLSIDYLLVIVLHFTGTDATTAFKETGHSKEAREILSKYFIGNLIKVRNKDNNNKNNKDIN